MDSSIYRKILEGYANVDSAKRGKLLRIYLHIPSLPKLRAVLIALAEKAGIGEEERMKYAESQVRQLCASRGLNWDAMTEEEREDFIDDLVHEDRECN